MVSPHLPSDWDRPDGLHPQHLHEWVDGSGVDPAIVELNVTSLSGEAVLELLVGDRLEQAGGHAQQFVTGEIRKLLHSREQLMDGGWWVEGVDTLNGCHAPAGWGIFKPDQPLTNPDGRVRKYEHQLGVAERIVALRMPDPDFWVRVKADPSITIVLDEGAKKAGAWLTAGIAALGLPGLFAGTPPVDPKDPEPRIGNGYGWRKRAPDTPPTKRKLHPDLVAFSLNRKFVISMDYEPTGDGIKRRDAATRHLVDQLYAAGAAEVSIAHREGPEKGSDDLLIAQGPDALHDLLTAAERQDRGPISPIYLPQPREILTGDRHVADLLADHIAARIYAARDYAAENDAEIWPVLDHLTNTPGTGKSHLVPQVGPRLLEIPGIERVIYVSSTYRTPSISELDRWIAPPSRHNGLVVENIDGHQRLRRRKKSDPDSAVVEEANCQYSGSLQRLRDQGGSNSSISHFCRNECPLRMGCRYLQDQSEFLSSLNGINRAPERLFRCSVESLPALKSWLGNKKWAGTYLIFDEAPQIESAQIRTHSIPIDRFAAWGTYLRSSDPAVMATPAGQQLTTLLDALATLSPVGEPFGLQPQQLIDALPPAPDPDELALAPFDPGITDIPADSEPQQQIDSPLLLGALLRSLRPRTTGPRAFYDKGTITLLLEAGTAMVPALSAAGSLVLDGTALTADIKRALHGNAPAPAPHLEPQSIETPSNLAPACLEIVQIPDLGPMGRSRGADKQRRLEALIPAISQYVCGRYGEDAHTGVLEKSHFRSREAGHGVWFVDNQGSNAYQLDRALVMVGCPAPNLTASLAQYQVTHHNPHATLNSESFRRWYAARMGEQIIQGLHRLRPIRRQGETLLLFLITSIDLKGLRITTNSSGLSFKQISSAYFTKAAAPKAERTRQLVITAIKILHLEGTPPEQITCRLVAEKAQVGRNTAHRQAGNQDWVSFVQSLLP